MKRDFCFCFLIRVATNSGIEEEVPLVSEEQVLVFHSCERPSCIYNSGEVASFFGQREEDRLKVSGG